MKYSYLFLCQVLLLLTGCAPDYFGPLNVPEEYSTDQVVKTSKQEVDEELKELHKLPEASYTISSEDHFNIVVYGYPDIGVTNIIITPDGFLNMPLIGPVKVGGLTVKEANLKVTEKLSYYIKGPKVAVIPVQVTGFSFVIAGQVVRPGKYPIAIGRTRLIDAVALAQGFTNGLHRGTTVSLADLDNTYIAREGKILPVNFNKALLQGNSLHNIPLQNGDYIYVPQVMGSSIAVLGEVNRQDYVGYHEGLTLVNALTFCMGLMETHADNVKIIRGGLKDPVVYTVNITKMLEGKIKDFPLQPNDIVFVPRDGLSDWNVMVRKILPTLQGMSMLAGPFGNPSGLYMTN